MSTGLLDAVQERLGEEEGEVVAAFAKAYLRRLGPGAADEQSTEALRAEVVGAFRFASSRDGAPAAVRAFNPTPDEHGYATPGSVLETNTADLPFLVDSISSALAGQGIGIRRLLHPIIGTERAPDGRIVRICHPRDARASESVMHFELDRRLAPEALADLEDTARRVLADVQRVVEAEPELGRRLEGLKELARAAAPHCDAEEIDEVLEFLDWLRGGAFVFLGHREDEVADGALRPTPGSGTGLLHDAAGHRRPAPEPGSDLVLVGKTRGRSTVKRPVRMDAVQVRRFAADGSVVGESVLVGLFTSRAYGQPAGQTPILRRKLRRMLDAEDLIEGSHDYKAAVALFEAFPKDELFAAPAEDLARAVIALLSLQGDEVRMLGRRSPDGRTISLIAALPRAAYTARLVEQVRSVLAERFPTAAIDVHEALVEGDRAQVHYTLHATETELPGMSLPELDRKLAELARTWDDRVREHLVEAFGEERGRMLTARWAPRLPEYYKAGVAPELAVHDIARFQHLLTSGEPFTVGLQQEPGDRGPLRTRVGLYKTGGKLELSRVMPILEDLGLGVVEEVPTRLVASDGQEMWLQDFGVLGPDGQPLELGDVADRVADAIAAVWQGEAESDALNQLVVTAGLTWRQVAILRAYRKYRQRIGSRFTESYQNQVILENPDFTARLMALFEARFDPAREGQDASELELLDELHQRLEDVTSLDHDRVLRNQLGLIQATVRTNAYKPGRDVLSLKVRSGEVPAMPQPAPLYEIFVYAPDVEGVHLRGGLIARGGLRWSDRMDYRTEVFGLMRAQMTKNAVIVPEGAKGGFYVRRPPSDPAALKRAVREAYVRYVSGLLDVTDNRRDGTVTRPEHVRVRDDDDAYLVVAADKGTATFSDTANGVAAEYGFWLDDAFASGGSAGYDHKALGITARGAWESLRRHFRERGLDPERDAYTVVGIGDMSGDVFGNGMLLSRSLRLVAAYDHRHVFIDPDPQDPARAWEERRRLFELAGSSWDDYDRELLSEGGGVYPRSAKSVTLSPQARKALGIDADRLAPSDLISAILRAPVDVLWNGGIGTVVKASTESHDDAQDRGSDAIRVDGRDLRCAVVVEGGNLGLTQQARIEYAAGGGRVNADFVDNSAGVACSDHEVNLKILLQLAVRRGELDRAGRDELLREVTDDVVEHVLYGSFQQAQIISEEELTSGGRLWAYGDLMDQLQEQGLLLRREVEALPSGEDLAERAREGRGLERPELAVLVAYAKRSLTRALLDSPLVDDPFFGDELRGYFPPAVVARFGHLLPDHPLRRELVATLVANEVVDAMGATFVSRLASERGAPAADIVRAWRIARDVTHARVRWHAVETLDPGVPAESVTTLMAGIEWLVEVVTRHYLDSPPPGPLEDAISGGRAGFERIARDLEDLGGEAWRARRREAAAALAERGVPEHVAYGHAFQAALVHAPDAVAVAAERDRPVEEVARAFFLVEDRAELGWIERQIESLPVTGRMARWAQQALRDDVLRVRRDLVARTFDEAGAALSAAEAVDAFFERRTDACRRLGRFVRMLAHDGANDLAGLTLALRQVRALVDAA